MEGGRGGWARGQRGGGDRGEGTCVGVVASAGWGLGPSISIRHPYEGGAGSRALGSFFRPLLVNQQVQLSDLCGRLAGEQRGGGKGYSAFDCIVNSMVLAGCEEP